MYTINSDDPVVERQIEKICALLLKAGGTISDDIILESAKNSQRIVAKEVGRQGVLLAVPHNALIDHRNFQYAIEDGDLVIKSCRANTDENQMALAENVAALYNLTSKIKQHCETSPWVSLLDCPAILDELILARDGTDLELVRQALAKNKDGNLKKSGDAYNNFVRMTFFKSRLLGCRLNKESAEKKKVLMPIVDFLNHHTHGAVFANDYAYKGGARLGVSQVTPVEGDSECFACYGRMDALDTYLHYGFVDSNAVFVRSIPLRIDLGECGTLRIGGENTLVPKAGLPEDIADMHFYMPVIKAYYDDKAVALSHIMIPSVAAPRSMKRILALAITHLGRDIRQSQVDDLVRRAEEEIVSKNEAYYLGLRNRIENQEGLNPKKSLKDVPLLCEAQLRRVEIYKETCRDL